MLHPTMLRCVALTCCGRLAGAEIRANNIQMSQHIETRRSKVAKSTEHVAPNKLRYVELKCRERLAGHLVL